MVWDRPVMTKSLQHTMTKHDIEIERTGTKPAYWADCSCGWFHGASNRDQARQLAIQHTVSMLAEPS